MATENLKITKIGTKYYLELVGDLDEDANYSNLIMPDASEVVVNFDKVTRIQSSGIREWIQHIKPYSSLPFVYEKCPRIIVDQINMIDGFLPKNGRVQSLYVPYYIEETGSERHVLFTYGVEYDNNGIYPPKEIRDDAGKLMEMDIVEARYFKFLKLKKPAA